LVFIITAIKKCNTGLSPSNLTSNPKKRVTGKLRPEILYTKSII